MNLTVTRASCAHDDAAAVDELLSVIPYPIRMRAYLAHVERDSPRLCHAVQYNMQCESLFYFATDGQRLVRMCVAGVPQQRAAFAIVATHDVINASAKSVGIALEKMLVLPAHVHPETTPAVQHPELRLGSR